MNIRYQRELLQQIAAGLNHCASQRVAHLVVVFVFQDHEYRFGLVDALDALANDIYWDERGNWSEARVARVESI